MEGFNDNPVTPSYTGAYVCDISPFVLHTTHGVPLSLSWLLLSGRKIKPNLARFFFESVREGWSERTAISVIRDACQDNDHPFDKDEFLALAELMWLKLDSTDAIIDSLPMYLRSSSLREIYIPPKDGFQPPPPVPFDPSEGYVEVEISVERV